VANFGTSRAESAKKRHPLKSEIGDPPSGHVLHDGQEKWGQENENQIQPFSLQQIFLPPNLSAQNKAPRSGVATGSNQLAGPVPEVLELGDVGRAEVVGADLYSGSISQDTPMAF